MRAIVVACAIVALAVSASALKEFEFEDESQYSFERYVRDFRKAYDPHQYVAHYKTYLKNMAAIVAHNRDHTQTWRQAVNKFTDMDDDERSTFLGFSLQKKLSDAVGAREASAEDLAALEAQAQALPRSVDWRTKTNPTVLTPVKDQQQCGSCWAHATVEQVEVAVAFATNQNPTPLSRQNVVDCAPNPNHCGGTGGCEGATAELGFAYISDKGVASEQAYPYQGVDGTCNEQIAKSASIKSWVVLPSNNYTAIASAVVNTPLAITVAAGTWFSYSSGVFTGCGQDFDLDHAVQLAGYGNDAGSGMDYWIVRNSWSAGWGEGGYIRIQKHSDGGSQWCGIDSSPGDGTGCQNGPSQVTACGSCGLWYDVCYATGGFIPSAEKPAPAAPAPATPAPATPAQPEIPVIAMY